MATDVIGTIDEIIEGKSLLTHPFYQAWNEGTLPIESLKKYAAQYYHFESAYPTFLSGVHHRCTDPSVRQHLLDNLWDEEHGEDNHVELWLRFCEGLGVDRSEVLESEPLDATTSLVDTYKSLTSSGSTAAGAAALYAFESQVPKVATAKIAGLRENYGIEDKDTTSFFEVHKTLDEQHSDAEREMIEALATTKPDRDAAVMAADIATESLWRFLDGVY